MAKCSDEKDNYTSNEAFIFTSVSSSNGRKQQQRNGKLPSEIKRNCAAAAPPSNSSNQSESGGSSTSLLSTATLLTHAGIKICGSVPLEATQARKKESIAATARTRKEKKGNKV